MSAVIRCHSLQCGLRTTSPSCLRQTRGILWVERSDRAGVQIGGRSLGADQRRVILVRDVAIGVGGGPLWRATSRRGDQRFPKAPRFGTHNRSGGGFCCQPAMPNGRCRLHGGKSTGPRSPEGLERSRRSSWKHARRSAKAIAERRELRALVRALRATVGVALGAT
jgi:hypothetical protein